VVSKQTHPPLVAIYADESCLGNGREGENPGGAAALLEFLTDGARLVRRDLWVSEPATTNNRMALRSVIESFRALSRKNGVFRVVFTTDSRYIVDGMSRWVLDWAKRGWRRKGGPIENLDLWREAVAAASPHAVEWRWVRGHAGHAQNEYANDLAVRAAGEQTSSDGLENSAFEQWLMDQEGAGSRVQLAEFPAQRSFRASARLPGSEGGSQ